MITKRGHGYQVDFYCLGAILFELLTGLPPFCSNESDEIFKAALTEQISFPSDIDIDDKVRSLILGLMNKDPNQRLGSQGGMQEILAHSALKNFSRKDMLERKYNALLKPDLFEVYFETLPENFPGHQSVLDKIAEDLIYAKSKKKEETIPKVWSSFYFCAEKEELMSVSTRSNERFNTTNGFIISSGANVMNKNNRVRLLENKSADFSLRYKEDSLLLGKGTFNEKREKDSEPVRAPEKIKFKMANYSEILKFLNRGKQIGPSLTESVEKPFNNELGSAVFSEEMKKPVHIRRNSGNNQIKPTARPLSKIKLNVKLTEEDKRKLNDLISKKLPSSFISGNKSITILKPEAQHINNSQSLVAGDSKLNPKSSLFIEKLQTHSRPSGSECPIKQTQKGRSIQINSKDLLAKNFLASDNFKSKLISFMDKNHRLPVLSNS